MDMTKKRKISEMFPLSSISKKQKLDFDDLSQEQNSIFEAFKNGQNIYIAGEAGTGKTTLLQKMIRYCKLNGRNYIVSASTGFASQHVGGITLHSALNHVDFKDVNVLFIDEINMLGPYFMAAVANKIAKMKRKPKPFGGIQVILSGDKGQLEPIEDIPFTKSPLFHTFKFKKFKLSQHFRQKDDIFINILRRLRKNKLTDSDHQILRSLVMTDDELKNFDAIRVFPKKKEVEYYNREKLLELNRPTTHFKIERPKKLSKSMDEYINLFISSLPIYETINLCIGCPVIIVANVNTKIVNGMRGIITDIRNGSVEVQFNNEEKHRITKFEWHVKKHGKTYAIIKQIPLILGWAISSHKCQCATFDKLVASIDKNIFARNQVYTLLSRVKSLEDVRFVEYDQEMIK